MTPCAGAEHGIEVAGSDGMSERPGIEESFARLGAALGRLEAALEHRAEIDGGKGLLEEQLQRLDEDRSRLAQDLDQAEARSARIEDTNKEVSRRLVAAMESIRTVLERHGG